MRCGLAMALPRRRLQQYRGFSPRNDPASGVPPGPFKGSGAPRKRGSPRRNSGFSPSFRMLINSNEFGTLPQARGTLDSFFDNSLLAVGGRRSRPPLLGARQ